MDIIRHRKTFFAVSGALAALALFAIVAFGFRQGIDFKGGTLWQFRVGGDAGISDMEEVFETTLGFRDAVLSRDASNETFLVRLPVIDEGAHQSYTEILTRTYPDFEELSFQSIGPSIGAALRKNALIAIGLVLVGISLYIAFVFRKVSRPVSSWKYGVVTLFTLFHDVLIPAGLLAALGRYQNIDIDSNFVVALLVVMGFSVHDTIVVFDRIRENLRVGRGGEDFASVINQSVNQTFARSLNTSLTLILVLVALYIVGPLNLRYFILTLLAGVTVGTYSSIFIASPALFVWQRASGGRRS
jgi:preprotein translocase subunit SecF